MFISCSFALRHVDLLKIDVERAELDVLRGLQSGQWSSINQVVMEVSANGGLKRTNKCKS